MSTDILNKVLRVGEGRVMKGYQKRVVGINALEPSMQELSDEELRAKADEFRTRLEDGETLDDIADEALAVAREVSVRTMGMRPYDVQMIGAMVLHEGRIAEMKTGEGKTLAGVPAVYLNALEGKGVHVVTVNDYLARRDSVWMGPLYEGLGISVGVIASQMPEAERRAAYAADVTYGTNSEFGFDYLRDNMTVKLSDCVQRGHNFCVVDEVDSILIDEARTPLIISGVPEAATDTYYRFARIVPTLRRDEDYEVDEKQRTVAPTESGVEKVEKALGIENLYLDVNGQLVNHLNQALRAQALFRKDKEYIVRDGQVLIVDEFTGRVLEGRRYSEGLHQAIEAKEGLKIREENQTLATITLQNYFRLYDKLSGMTGTAVTEANEFAKIYETDVVAVPTHRDVIRDDEDDFIFKTEQAKFDAVTADIRECHERGQPVLVGTASVESSERVSRQLQREGIPHDVLNAKNHAREAEIIENAGQPGAVTIATNMAGRGVDIKLGKGVASAGVPEDRRDEVEALIESGTPFAEAVAAAGVQLDPEIRRLGGLYVIGTERHESRRIDNQLRGRSGRQGDPGRTRFYLSAEDNLIRIFAGDRIYKILDKLGPDDDAPIESRMLSKTIEGAQKKVEEQNFNIRKRVLEYDDVLNKQRQVIYQERREVLHGADLSDKARDWVAETLVDVVEEYEVPEQLPGAWDLDGLFASLKTYFPISFGPEDLELDDESDPFTKDDLLDEIEDDAMERYDERETNLNPALVRDLERWVLLQLVDVQWREHLYAMDYLREGIHLRSLGQKDPLAEYRMEGHSMFDEMTRQLRHEFTRYIFHLEVNQAPEVEQQQATDVDYTYAEEPVQGVQATTTANAEANVVFEAGDGAEPEPEPAPTRTVVEQRQADALDRVGRNDPCPCGSGKKFKRCYGTPECGLSAGSE